MPGPTFAILAAADISGISDALGNALKLSCGLEQQKDAQRLMLLVQMEHAQTISANVLSKFLIIRHKLHLTLAHFFRLHLSEKEKIKKSVIAISQSHSVILIRSDEFKLINIKS